MKVLLISFLVYLLGIVGILYFKPKLMFDEKGNWKEFGFADTNHTWFPFWLFCIVWSIVSYATVSCIVGDKKKKKVSDEMKPGYYALDKETSREEGFPKYVYLGANIPMDNRDE